jgi:diguanylate cyclase (GGDEF)-like protein
MEEDLHGIKRKIISSRFITRSVFQRSRPTCLWALIAGVLGYFIIHPWVMITAHLMFRPRLKAYFSMGNIIFEEFVRAFSLEMLPWGLAFAVLSSLSGAFYGRSRQAIAALRASEQRFKEMSITDELTGLHNSRHFFSRLKAEIKRTDRYGHPLTLLILDLDNFKQYNDTFGHLSGDKVLAETGNIIRKSIRSTDSAYRYGGEEFAVILPESSGQESLYIAERIRKSFESEALFDHKKDGLRVTVSIGVAQYVREEEMSTFIKTADENMYAAKNAGKNRICCAQ